MLLPPTTTCSVTPGSRRAPTSFLGGVLQFKRKLARKSLSASYGAAGNTSPADVSSEGSNKALYIVANLRISAEGRLMVRQCERCRTAKARHIVRRRLAGSNLHRRMVS